jgi:hypothetical protein
VQAQAEACGYNKLPIDCYSVLGVTGEHWVASFYSPTRCARHEGRGPTAALAICRAAKETFTHLVKGI